MAVSSFNRRQWASQSLRITAKELSIVGPQGKNSAIAERFSKYQQAAEEISSDKKKLPLSYPLLIACFGCVRSIRSWKIPFHIRVE